MENNIKEIYELYLSDTRIKRLYNQMNEIRSRNVPIRRRFKGKEIFSYHEDIEDYLEFIQNRINYIIKSKYPELLEQGVRDSSHFILDIARNAYNLGYMDCRDKENNFERFIKDSELWIK